MGPCTKAGKAKASQNARWHHLAAALSGEPGAVEELKRVAQAIVVEAGRRGALPKRRLICGAFGARWIPTRSAIPSTALVPQRKSGFHSERRPSARFPGDEDGSARRNIEPLQ
jgi:hypothetical protein